MDYLHSIGKKPCKYMCWRAFSINGYLLISQVYKRIFILGSCFWEDNSLCLFDEYHDNHICLWTRGVMLRIFKIFCS